MRNYSDRTKLMLSFQRTNPCRVQWWSPEPKKWFELTLCVLLLYGLIGPSSELLNHLI